MSHIFVSYSSHNKTYARTLADYLMERGFDVWFDTDDLSAGDRWWNEIVQAVQDCAAFIVIMTPQAQASRWVEREVGLADDLNKPLFPLLLDGSNWPLFVRTQYEDVTPDRMPSPAFINRLAQNAPTKPRRGIDVTAVSYPDLLDRLLAAEDEGRWQDAHQVIDLLRPFPEARQIIDQEAPRIKAEIQRQEEEERQNRAKQAFDSARQGAYQAVLVLVRRSRIEQARPLLNEYFKQYHRTFDGSGIEIHDPERLAIRLDVRFPFEPETVLVLGGPFLMGSDREHDPQACDNELPQRTIPLPDYQIGRYPVTVGEYRAFIETGGYRAAKWWTESGWQWRVSENAAQPKYWDDPKWTGDDRLPVIGVSWYEAYAYCQWLTEITGKPYRLPGEAEWEKAARGVQGRTFPWGSTWQTGLCNSAESGIGHTTPVGQFSPAGDGPYGAADMSGNVWEWCASAWADKHTYPEDCTPDGNAWRVVRGGSWRDDQDYARAALRGRPDPYTRSHSLGFRVVCAPHP